MKHQLENIQQKLVEIIADFLDSNEVIIDEAIGGYSDPIPREETELHTRMAIAAMDEYKNTIKPI